MIVIAPPAAAPGPETTGVTLARTGVADRDARQPMTYAGMTGQGRNPVRRSNLRVGPSLLVLRPDLLHLSHPRLPNHPPLQASLPVFGRVSTSSREQTVRPKSCNPLLGLCPLGRTGLRPIMTLSMILMFSVRPTICLWTCRPACTHLPRRTRTRSLPPLLRGRRLTMERVCTRGLMTV